jgi:peptidoglycan hydrolase CwlO-like protein
MKKTLNLFSILALSFLTFSCTSCWGDETDKQCGIQEKQIQINKFEEDMIRIEAQINQYTNVDIPEAQDRKNQAEVNLKSCWFDCDEESRVKQAAEAQLHRVQAKLVEFNTQKENLKLKMQRTEKSIKTDEKELEKLKENKSWF